MPYCLYLRKSRADMEAETRGEGETLTRHEKALLELAKRQNLNITQIYREIVSGETIAARPIMQRLLTEVERSVWDGVLVMEVERLARGDTIDQGIVAQTFKLTDTKIITPLKTYDPNDEYDEEYFEFGLFMSRREYKTINRRLQRGRVAAVKEGKYVGNRPPYGYIRKKIAHDSGFTLEPEPEQALVVKLIFCLYAHGECQADGTVRSMGVGKIVRKLNDLKIPTTNGGAWANSTLQSMLRNPVYIGKIRWNGRPSKKRMVDGQLVKERPRTKPEDWILADGLHEPLIDAETWQLTQLRLVESPSRPCPWQHTIMNPLAGLILCGVCGRRMVRRPYGTSGSPDTLMCPAVSCSNISAPLKYVEDHVIEALQQWLEIYKHTVGDKRAESAGFQIAIKQKALHSFKNELSALIKQRDNIYSLLEQGVYSTDIFEQRFQAIIDKIRSVQKSIVLLEKDITEKELTEPNEIIIIPALEHVLEEYKNADTASEKNELLKEVLEKVIFTKNVNGRWHGKPDDFELILYPKLPKKT